MISYNAKIDSNNLVLSNVCWYMVMEVIVELEVNQFTAVRDQSDSFIITMPINKIIEEEYAALIHRSRSENLLNKSKDPQDPDDKPPRPTNPRGSGGKVVAFENTIAIAA